MGERANKLNMAFGMISRLFCALRYSNQIVKEASSVIFCSGLGIDIKGKRKPP
jgi:hypothetical protein